MPLPPDLQALAELAHPPLQSAAVRLSPADLDRVDRLRDRLGHPPRAAVLRGLVRVGLDMVERQVGEVVIHG